MLALSLPHSNNLGKAPTSKSSTANLMGRGIKS